MAIDYFKKLQKEVISQGNCTHCGTCIGLCPKLSSKETKNGPLPINPTNEKISDKRIYTHCPGRKISYKSLNKFLFNKLPKSMALGNYLSSEIAFASNKTIRKNGASGGITTAMLIYLLEEKIVDGVVVLKQGTPKPYLAEPIIATTKEEIIAASQSVYIPVMVNKILPEISNFEGKLAYVGLPDQVAMIRQLQKEGDSDAKKIEYIFGPYVGTGIYADALKSFLRSNGYKSLDDIKSMKYRDGEWPGYLRIETKDGKTLKSKKFYYNYLIPFYVTQASIQAVDFTNELTDISVGDAWHPKYEGLGQGFSVVLARTVKGKKLYDEMKSKGLISGDPVDEMTVINMHGHMIDFKKRGTFIRLKSKKFFGKKVPDYDYFPKKIGLKRYVIESFIILVFSFCKTRFARKLIEILPMRIVGKAFNTVRLSWKKISKSTKRKGIANAELVYR